MLRPLARDRGPGTGTNTPNRMQAPTPTPTQPQAQPPTVRAVEEGGWDEHLDRESSLRMPAHMSTAGYRLPRTAPTTAVGVGGGAGIWASDKTDGHASKYLAETKAFMRTRAQELQLELKQAQSETQFTLICNQLRVMAQHIRAVLLVEYVESLSLSTLRGASKTWLYCVHGALESMRDLLIVTNIKIRSKWMTAEGLTAAAAREAIATLRVRASRLVGCLQRHSVPSRYSHVEEDTRGRSLQSLVMVVPGSGRDGAHKGACALFPTAITPWVEFGNSAGCMTLRDELTTDKVALKSTTTSDKLHEVQKVSEALSNYDGVSMSESALLGHLRTVQQLLLTGFQSMLYTNSLCHGLVNVLRRNPGGKSVYRSLLSLIGKLCFQDAACVRTLVELGVWGCWANFLSTRRAEPDVCISCCQLMSSLLSCSEDWCRAAVLTSFDVQGGFDQLVAVLHRHPRDLRVCRAVHSAVQLAVDKTCTSQSTFVTSGMCEVLIASLVQYSALVPGVKLQLVTLLEKLSAGNRFMQERMVSLDMFDILVDIINSTSDANLLKHACMAVSALAGGYHAAQTKFATAVGCKALCQALQETPDLTALINVMRTIATLALRNSYVQDFFQLESAAELLLAKKEEITALSTRSESFETKSLANLLLLSLEFALDTVRIPAAHHSAHHDLTAIAAITTAGRRRAEVPPPPPPTTTIRRAASGGTPPQQHHEEQES